MHQSSQRPKTSQISPYAAAKSASRASVYSRNVFTLLLGRGLRQQSAAAADVAP